LPFLTGGAICPDGIIYLREEKMAGWQWPWEKRPTRWSTLFAALGIGLRLYHYGRNPSMWHDEAVLVLNVIQKDFTALLGPLLFAEASPPLFLWIERAAFLLFGEGTYALRLAPCLASCLTVVLFALLARRTLPRASVPWAVLLFSCSDWLLWHACEAKPYAVDVLAALLLPCVFCLTSDWPLRRQLALYILLAPLVIFAAYPGCFLCGGLLIALLPAVCRAKQTATWLAYGLLLVAVGCAFLLLLEGPIRAQRCEAMTQCWLRQFPPRDRIWMVPIWTVASSFEVFRYGLEPLGQVFVLPAAVGVHCLWRHGQRQLILLLGVPVALALVAAFLRAYPYGGVRVMAYAAPALALCSATGIPVLLRWLRQRSPLSAVALGVLLLAPVGRAIQHVVVPWNRADCAGAAAYVLTHRRPADQVVGNTWEYRYYFRRLGSAFIPLDELTSAHGRIWLVISGVTPDKRLGMAQDLAKQHGAIREQHSFEWTTVFLLQPPGADDSSCSFTCGQ
jgi:hypothetical protein